MKKLYKFLNLKDGKIKSNSGNITWKVGEWQNCKDELKLCEVGFHCSQTPYQAFSYVQGEVLAIVETKGKFLDDTDKSVHESMRIVKAYKWQKKDSVAFAIYAAELVLENFEKEYPDYKRPREAIEAAKKVLFEDTEQNRSAARSAARSAESAAESAARSAARSAAESAAWSARSAESAARSARSAESAARSAARSAESAARSSRSAAYKKLGIWMTKHIKELEEIK